MRTVILLFLCVGCSQSQEHPRTSDDAPNVMLTAEIAERAWNALGQSVHECEMGAKSKLLPKIHFGADGRVATVSPVDLLQAGEPAPTPDSDARLQCIKNRLDDVELDPTMANWTLVYQKFTVPGPQSPTSLNPEVIQGVIRGYYDRFRVCYQRALAVNPTAEGKVTVRFQILADGTTQITDRVTQLPADTTQCVIDVYSKIRFPRPSGGVTVVYPINFSPADASPSSP